MKRKVATAVTTIILTLFLAGTAYVQSDNTIYIRADGSVVPSTAPISSVDNITYTFTADIYDSIVVERDNIVVDGAGYMVKGTGWPGIQLSNRNNVTLKNVEVTNFRLGVSLSGSDNIIADNTFHSEYAGILLGGEGNTLIGNTISGSLWGIFFGLGSEGVNNIITGNHISSCAAAGIHLGGGSYNNIFTGNTFQNNRYGFIHYTSESSIVFHNNFINNDHQVNSYHCAHTWDDGYPSGGNYWSDYSTRYPDAQELDDSGIWDTPYIIDDYNQDNYPLMEPWEVPPVEDTEAYIEYVNETMQDLPDELFVKQEEDVPEVKNDFSDLFDDALQNVDEGNYEGVIEKLDEIKEKIYEEMVESAEREEIISLIDDLIAYLE